MHNILQYVILGLGAGAVYALLGDGLVLIYRGSGVLNFAQGAYAMSGAYAFYELHTRSHWGFLPAFLLAVGAVTAIGALTQVLVLRRLSTGLAKVIATLGVLAILEGLASIRYGSAVTEVSSSLPQTVLRVFRLAVPEDQMWILVIAVVVAAVLYVVTRFTTLGLVMTAMAESTTSTAALGWSPGLIATLTWSAGAALAAVAGILISPLTGLSVTDLTLLVIAAMAAALAGGFVSFPLTLAAAMVIGIGQSLMAGYVSTPGVSESLPFIVIILVLVLRGRALPTRTDLFESLPRLGSGIIRPLPILIGAGFLTIGMITFFPTALTIAVTVQIIAATILLSIVVLTGYAGQLSLAQFALAGAGALVAGHLVASLHWPFTLALVVGVLAAAIVGVVFALPALRTRGVNLAVVTLGLGVACQDLVFGNSNWTGGGTGLVVGNSSFLGIHLNPISHPITYALFCLAWLTIVGLVVANVRRSTVGRRLVAIRTNERAAASLGVNVLTSKLFAFALSAGIAGLGGILLAFENQSIVFSSYSTANSINAVGYAVIGGIGHVTGPLFGSGLQSGGIGSYVLGRFGSLDKWLVFIGGVFLIVTLLQNPEGIAGELAKKWQRRRARRVPRPAVVVPDQSEEIQSVAQKVLQVDKLTVVFGGITAVCDVTFSVAPGQVVGLIGPNGAGKSTIVEAITGFVRPRSGRVLLDGHNLDGLSPHQRARAGVVRSFQSLELFDDLTVAENLLAASDSRRWTEYLKSVTWTRRAALNAGALTAVREFGIGDKLQLFPSELSYGDRRLVAIARAVAGSPSILLLDEPAAGLDDTESRELSRLIRRLADEWGIGVLVIEHDVSLVMRTCDQVVAINFGEKIAEAPPSVLRREPAVIAAYLGEEEDTSVPSQAGSHVARAEAPLPGRGI